MFKAFFEYFMRDRELDSILAKNLIVKKELDKFIEAYKIQSQNNDDLKTLVLTDQKLKEAV